jgi:hypothetical protein
MNNGNDEFSGILRASKMNKETKTMLLFSEKRSKIVASSMEIGSRVTYVRK